MSRPTGAARIVLLAACTVAVTAVAIAWLPWQGPTVDGGRPPAPGPTDAKGADAAALLRAASAEHGGSLFRQCTGCHSIGRNGPDLDGPNLYGVVGSRVAQRRSRYGYTAALRAVGGTWTFARLDAWLTDPHRFAPGTSMPFAGLPDPRDRADLIAYLNQQGSSLPLP